MHIREAVVTDAAGIARVSIDTWRATYQGIMPDTVLQGLSYKTREERAAGYLVASAPGSVHLVAEARENGIVGFVDGGPERSGAYPFDAEIYAIYVLPHAQGQGLGKRLFLTTTERLQQNGFASLMLWAAAANPARGFYRACGGIFVDSKHVQIDGVTIEEVAYGWTDIATVGDRSHTRPDSAG